MKTFHHSIWIFLKSHVQFSNDCAHIDEYAGDINLFSTEKELVKLNFGKDFQKKEHLRKHG